MKKIFLSFLISLLYLNSYSQKIGYQLPGLQYYINSYCKYDSINLINTSDLSLIECNYYKWIMGNGDSIITYDVKTPVKYSYKKYGEFKVVLEGYKIEGGKRVLINKTKDNFYYQSPGGGGYYTETWSDEHSKIIRLTNQSEIFSNKETYCPKEHVLLRYVNNYSFTKKEITLFWDFNDGNKSNNKQPETSTNYDKPGTYYIKLMFKDTFSCPNLTFYDTITKKIVVSSFVQPTPDFYLPSKICLGETIQLEPNENYVKCEWDMGDKNKYFSNEISHKYNESYTYDVNLSVTNLCGNQKSITKKIEVSETHNNINTDLDFDNFDTSCVNDKAVFVLMHNNSLKINSIDFGDGSSSYEIPIDIEQDKMRYKYIYHKYTTIGKKNVTIYLTNIACGSDTIVQTSLVIGNRKNKIIGNYYKSISIYNNSNIKNEDVDIFYNLLDSTIIMTDLVTSGIYEWDLGDNIRATTDIPFLKYKFNSSGERKISVKFTNGCGETDSISNYVYIYPVANNNNVLSTNINHLNDKIEIYPNPSNGHFQLKVSEQLIGNHFMITDLTGKCIYKDVINQMDQEINLESFTNGTYFITIENSNSYKLIKF